MIKKYDTEAAYEAATKSTTESTISHVEESKSCKVDGVNVVTPSPGIGDILCVNTDGEKLWIACDTYNADSLPSGYTAQAVVAARHGMQLILAYKKCLVAKYLPVYPYIVSDYVLDGAKHTVQIRLHGKPSTSTYYDFVYTATTDAEFVATLQSFLTEKGESDWSAYIDDDGKVILQYNNHTSAEYYSTSYTHQNGGIKLTMKFLQDANDIIGGTTDSPFIRYGLKRNGLWHEARGLDFFKNDSSSSMFNPNSALSSIPYYPICYPAYTGQSEYRKNDDGTYIDNCAYLRELFGEGEEGWKNYIHQMTIDKRSPMLTNGQHRDSLRITNELAAITYKDTDGNSQSLYPLAKFAHDVDLGTDGLGAGSFFVPSLAQYADILGYVTAGVSGNSFDPMNRSLKAIGGDVRTAEMTYSTLLPGGAVSVWIAGYSGVAAGSGVWSAKRSAPFALYELPSETA